MEMLPLFFLTVHYYAYWQGIGKGMFKLINWFSTNTTFYGKKSICDRYAQNINAEFLGADANFGFAACLII